MKLGLRIWLLIIILILSLLSIAPWMAVEKGVVIKSVETNSSASEAGLKAGQVILFVNGNKINSVSDYTNSLKEFPTNESVKLFIKTTEQEYFLFTDKSPEITVSSRPKSNIKLGLDLQGGARALVKPEEKVSSSDIDDLIAVTSERLNIYGLTDIVIKSVSDLQENNYMLVEIAGATPSEMKDLIAQQGKFEAKIGNETAFVGGKKDIASVCRNDATCAGVESCSSSEGKYICNFRFTIYLSEAAAKNHADITSKLDINSTPSGNYLSKKLDLFVDDVLVDSLFISEDLKGRITTQVSVTGSGVGETNELAIKDAQKNMQKLQTILITGSLPYKLEIVKLDTISPILGKEFVKNLILLTLLVFAIISVVLFIKYKEIKITSAVILTMFSEAFITLGIAALISWNLDAPSIAGIIAGMGTGVDDQIVILDESTSRLSGESLKERIKRALSIIISAFLILIVAMLPLFWAGAGLLRGFALTTIISVTIGILITRPAFAEIIRRIQKE